MIAQIQTPSSGDFWNPTNWQWLGGDKFLVVLFAAALLFFVWKALAKWDGYLTRAEKMQERQLNQCNYMGKLHTTPGGPGNTDKLRRAGIEIVELARNIGKAAGADDVDKRADAAIKHLEPPNTITPDAIATEENA